MLSYATKKKKKTFASTASLQSDVVPSPRLLADLFPGLKRQPGTIDADVTLRDHQVVPENLRMDPDAPAFCPAGTAFQAGDVSFSGQAFW